MSDTIAMPPPGETAEAKRTPTVYFIDDSATMREVIKIAFRRENINVVTCADAASAISQFDENPPDVVITDVIMPDQDGYSVCSHIKQSERFGKTPVILMSGVVNKNVEVGMNVQPGQTLLSVVPLDDVWITANFKETQLAHMYPGQHVTISVDAFSRKYKGHVESIAGAAGARFSLLPPENATGNYVKVVQRVPVKIVLEPGENQDHTLRLGMSVEPQVWVK